MDPENEFSAANAIAILRDARTFDAPMRRAVAGAILVVWGFVATMIAFLFPFGDPERLGMAEGPFQMVSVLLLPGTYILGLLASRGLWNALVVAGGHYMWETRVSDQLAAGRYWPLAIVIMLGILVMGFFAPAASWPGALLALFSASTALRLTLHFPSFDIPFATRRRFIVAFVPTLILGLVTAWFPLPSEWGYAVSFSAFGLVMGVLGTALMRRG